ncbi:CBS domain-containing protein [Planomonospora sp. ID91781]|uniref:CBS domain-containing protein n=3 Tax=Planomonospora TaxID=1998 RepID=A0A161M7L9_9ACTN|nr:MULTISPECIES: CBS domain-containing protein [Planomonospora]MBG0821910.1 CBS domain-containing protein [Planomonospora sp. ID91781]GAT64963.1 CBS domain-containing protein [Planomonospora sphaerica]GGK46583.1 hypoxic response protein 1 [Planomonospora parontospora]GII06492.1 hypoxic response protein 1 [Planomonospora parontospora subsp. parontospora]
MSGETAKDLMSAGCQCIQAEETLDRAAQLMREMNVGALPICGSDDRLKGIITDRDIIVKCIAEGKDPARTTAGELATGLVWVPAEASVEEALTKMEQNQIKRLPVIENGRIVGMISEADLAKNLPDDKLADFVHRVYARA